MRLIFSLVAILLSGCATAHHTGTGQPRRPTEHELTRLSAATDPYETWVYASERCPIRVGVLASSQINAAVMLRAMPECPNTVVLMVSEGVLRLPESELRGIVAHEMGHVVLRHGTATAQRQVNEAAAKGISSGVWDGIGAAAGTMPGYGAIIQLGAILLGGASDLTIGLVARGYDRDQEREADEWGAQFLLRTQGKPECLAMASAFDRMAAQGGGGLALFSTHPGATGRAEKIRQICLSGGEVGATVEDVKTR